jgi:hypothetical protein
MMHLLRKLLLRRRASKAIKTECDTLRRWSERAAIGKQF